MPNRRTGRPRESRRTAGLLGAAALQDVVEIAQGALCLGRLRGVSGGRLGFRSPGGGTACRLPSALREVPAARAPGARPWQPRRRRAWGPPRAPRGCWLALQAAMMRAGIAGGHSDGEGSFAEFRSRQRLGWPRCRLPRQKGGPPGAPGRRRAWRGGLAGSARLRSRAHGVAEGGVNPGSPVPERQPAQDHHGQDGQGKAGQRQGRRAQLRKAAGRRRQKRSAAPAGQPARKLCGRNGSGTGRWAGAPAPGPALFLVSIAFSCRAATFRTRPAVRVRQLLWGVSTGISPAGRNWLPPVPEDVRGQPIQSRAQRQPQGSLSC